MNSPPTPGSPASSNSDLDDIPIAAQQFAPPGGFPSASSSSPVSPTKRRLGGGPTNPNGGKSRRREDSRRGGPSAGWERGKGEKDNDLVDSDLANYLKKELGDPLADGFSQVPS